jgi:hypothetical protein
VLGSASGLRRLFLRRLSVIDWSLDLEFVVPRDHFTQDFDPQNWLGDALRHEDEDFSTGTWDDRLRRVKVSVSTDTKDSDVAPVLIEEFR